MTEEALRHPFATCRASRRSVHQDRRPVFNRFGVVFRRLRLRPRGRVGSSHPASRAARCLQGPIPLTAMNTPWSSMECARGLTTGRPGAAAHPDPEVLRPGARIERHQLEGRREAGLRPSSLAHRPPPFMANRQHGQPGRSAGRRTNLAPMDRNLMRSARDRALQPALLIALAGRDGHERLTVLTRRDRTTGFATTTHRVRVIAHPLVIAGAIRPRVGADRYYGESRTPDTVGGGAGYGNG